MKIEDIEKWKLIADFQRRKMLDVKTKSGTPFLAMGGGIFTPNTRKKVLGIEKQPEPGMSRNTFWYKRRNDVETALIDLRLFIIAAGKDNVNQVITRQSLTPIVEALLGNPIVAQDEPDLNLAEISQLLIETGFNYLRSMFTGSAHYLSRPEQWTIEAAIDLSKNLVFRVEPLKKGKEEKKYEINNSSFKG